MSEKLTMQELRSAISELGERRPMLKDDDLFVLWFLRAYVCESEEVAATAITGGANDKGVDALLIDDDSRCVFIVQGKYHKTLNEKSESLSTVMGFSALAQFLNSWTDHAAKEFLEDAAPDVAERLAAARKKVRKNKYRTWLYFVTTGKVSSTIRKNVQQSIRQIGHGVRIEIVDGKRAMLLFRDYLDGVAPPIPMLELEMESAAGVRVNGVAQRLDSASNVESWVFSMRGDSVGALYEKTGRRIFARNIRGFMGRKTAVNQEMLATLETEPERFFFYNNGITIVCDAAERRGSQGKDFLEVGNPQIINGQQTTRTLAASPRHAAKGSVLVKVIRIPRDAENGTDSFEELVSRIVQGTNWQNAIKASDLVSNDRRQIELERSLRKLGYYYLRKRQSKSEARAVIGSKQFFIVTKEEFAQAVAGCDLDPYIIRSGRENLFKEQYYSQVFPNSDPHFYLPRFRLMREVTYEAKGFPERGYAKWMVLNFMWSHIAPLVRGKRNNRVFRRLCEIQHGDLVVPINSAIHEVFIEALKYYRGERGKGDAALDVSQFFKNRKGHHKRFAAFWKGVPSTRRTRFDRLLENAKKAVSDFED